MHRSRINCRPMFGITQRHRTRGCRQSACRCHECQNESKTRAKAFMIFEKLNVSREGQVLFVEISAPPMNLEGPELIRDLVSLLQRAEADDAVQVIVFKSADPDYFISHV